MIDSNDVDSLQTMTGAQEWHTIPTDIHPAARWYPCPTKIPPARNLPRTTPPLHRSGAPAVLHLESKALSLSAPVRHTPAAGGPAQPQLHGVSAARSHHQDKAPSATEAIASKEKQDAHAHLLLKPPMGRSRRKPRWLWHLSGRSRNSVLRITPLGSA